ncbi:hypothetical protein [Ruminococcus sp.]|uniref:hypothetical protein n=1 Tax=Ruminococcus sp. TaxID=41978 RepID=UPI0025CCDFB9|nr:hypothetical protein [Ruminococcus sp.]MBQ8966577.1 hypothetical protein [Ruminococcus sp.]
MTASTSAAVEAPVLGLAEVSAVCAAELDDLQFSEDEAEDKVFSAAAGITDEAPQVWDIYI